MRLYSRVVCASVFCVLTAAAFSQTNHLIATPQDMGAADPAASTHFSVYMPLTNKAALEQLLIDQTNTSSPRYHQWLTPAEFKARFGPSTSDVTKVERRLERAGFTITAEHTQSIEVEGPVNSVEALFSARLHKVRMPRGNMRFAAENHRLVLPAELASVGAVIPEFSPHLLAHVHSVKVRSVAATAHPNFRLSSIDSFYYPNDMREAYLFPSFRDSVVPISKFPFSAPVQVAGVGATIGIVISSVISPADLNDTFNSSLNLGGGLFLTQSYTANSNLPVPTVQIDKVDGGSGAFNPNSDDAFEASLDTQMSLGTAPGAKEILYDIPDLTDASIVAAYTQVDEENKVDVVSSSFGECELDYTAAANGGQDFTYILQIYHSLFAQGNAQGITFVASSGDNGAPACTSYAFDNNPTNGTNFVLGVENPADDPDVTAVGGTNLSTTATPGVNDATYAVENANYDPSLPAQFELTNGQIVSVGNNTWGSGGGYSSIFAKPLYQQLVNTGRATGRAVPDVSLMMGGCPGDADLTAQDCTMLPRSAAIIFIGGEADLLIGTSSSAPQMAGVIALGIELAGTRLGNINPLLYTLSALQTLASGKTSNLSQFYHRNISGNNNGYTVSPGQGYSPVLGNGTLFVKNFLQLQSAAASGAPDTASNP